VRCSVCGREFDELGYQLLVPGRTETFDTFECAARAQGLPWLGPPPHAPLEGVPAVEQASRGAAAQSVLAFLASNLVRARTRAALVGGTALLVTVATASGYVWLRDDAPERAARPVSPRAAALTSAETLRRLAGQSTIEATGGASEKRSLVATARERRPARRSASEAALVVSLADAEPNAEPRPERASPPSSPTPPASSAQSGPPPSPPAPPPPSPPASAPPRPVAPSSPPVADATSPTTRPGWGFGDKNHLHEGPPGVGATNAQAKKPRVRRRLRRR
jgi:hypothetical protein